MLLSAKLQSGSAIFWSTLWYDKVSLQITFI